MNDSTPRDGTRDTGTDTRSGGDPRSGEPSANLCACVRTGTTLLVLTMLTVGMVAPAAAAPVEDPDIDYSAGHAPGIMAHEDMVTIAEHDRAAMTSPLHYYDDSGTIQDLGDHAHINDSESLPVGVRYTQMNDTFLNEFPRVGGESGNSVSAVDDAADWTTATTGTGPTASVTDNDGGTATGVKSVQFTASSVQDGESATATYSNFSVTEDATKRVAFGAMSVESVTGDPNVHVRFMSTDGDYKEVVFNTSGNASSDAVLANSSGANLVFQERLADLPTEGSGDGSLEDIQQVDVYVADGDATVTIVGLDAERKSYVELGEIERDTDDDGEMETVMIEDYWEGGDMRLTGLDTLPSDLDNAVIRGLNVYNLHYTAEKAGDGMNNVSLSDAADYPAYDTMFDSYFRLTVPTAIDLSHGTIDLKAEQVSPSNWYQQVGYATGAGDTDLHNVSYTGITGQFDGEGKTVTLVSNVNAGENLDVHIKKVLTADAAENIEQTGAAGGNAGGGGFFSSGDGGIVGAILSPFGGAITGLLAFLGIKRRSG